MPGCCSSSVSRKRRLASEPTKIAGGRRKKSAHGARPLTSLTKSSTPTRCSSCRAAPARMISGAAYEGAKAKCDPDLVSHLGYEVREHFEAKLQAIERAFQMLTG